MVGTGVLGSGVGDMKVRAVSGQEKSWKEELYNRDSQENPESKV